MWNTSTASVTTRSRLGHQATNDVYRVVVEDTPSVFQEIAFRFADGSGREPKCCVCVDRDVGAQRGLGGYRVAAGLVLPLDLPLIAGVDTIR